MYYMPEQEDELHKINLVNNKSYVMGLVWNCIGQETFYFSIEPGL